MSEMAINLKSVVFGYGDKAILNIPGLEIRRGSRCFVHGPSGSGKSTLLALLTGILEPESGVVSILGQSLRELYGVKMDRFRGSHIGYIFQMFNLLPYVDVRQNIALACRLNEDRLARAVKRFGSLDEGVTTIAGRLGIGHLLSSPVYQLSVGQQQRVAAARAVLGAPELIIADEPTSALDSDHRRDFLNLLFSEADAYGATIVFVSHDRDLKSLFSESISLTDINTARSV